MHDADKQAPNCIVHKPHTARRTRTTHLGRFQREDVFANHVHLQKAQEAGQRECEVRIATWIGLEREGRERGGGVQSWIRSTEGEPYLIFKKETMFLMVTSC